VDELVRDGVRKMLAATAGWNSASAYIERSRMSLTRRASGWTCPTVTTSSWAMTTGVGATCGSTMEPMSGGGSQ
jgi:hypothetical protein